METTNFTDDLEFNRFGWIAVILLLVGCLGGITVGMGAIESTLALVAILIPTMVTMSFLLAVYPMKWIMISTVVTISVDILLLAYYVIN